MRKVSDAPRALQEGAYELEPFLDEAEAELLGEIVDLAKEAQRAVTFDQVNHRDLREFVATLDEMKQAIAASGSCLLQDYLAPYLQSLIVSAKQASARRRHFRPAVAVRLASAKIPFSAAEGSTYAIRLVAINTGNAAAESIAVRVLQPDLNIDAQASLDSLDPEPRPKSTSR